MRKFKISLLNKNLPIIVAVFLFLLSPGVQFGQAPNLGTAANFGLFTKTGALENTGSSFVTGNVGTNAGAFTGFSTATVTGEIHVVDAESAQAAIDVEALYSSMIEMTCGTTVGVTLGNDQVLTPNIYCIGAAATIEGDLYLDAQGDRDAIFIFLINGAFHTGALTNVVLINKASMCNVYWQVNGAFSIGANSVFRGNVVVNGAIAIYDGAYLAGRAFSKVGAVSLFNSEIVSLVSQPTATITAGNISGSQETLTAIVSNASGPFSFLWSPGGETTSAIDVPTDITALYTVTVTAMNGCSDALDSFTVQGALPIQLMYFKAKCDDQNVVLGWSTSFESNNDYYSVERSTDGLMWRNLGQVNGQIHSAVLSDYTFTDTKPYGELLYYRLKQTDLDGRSKYFKVITVKNCGNFAVTFDIYPNPSNGKFNITYKGDKDQVRSIYIYDALGQRIYNLEKYQSSIDLSGTPDGIYTVQLTSASKVMVARLLINKSGKK